MMPQLDAAFFPSQLLWLFIAFLALYMYLKYKALPKIEGVMSRRLSAIESDIKLAQELESKIVSLQEQCASEALKTNEQVSEIHNKMMLKCGADKKERLDAINQRFVAEQKKHTADILLAQKVAAEETPKTIIDYASFIISKTTGIKPKIEDLEVCYTQMHERKA